MPDAPRCGRPMRRCETAQSGPVLEDPVCGRPQDHPGPCRSSRALARYYRRKRERDTAARGERYEQARGNGADYLKATRLKDVRPARWPAAGSRAA